LAATGSSQAGDIHAPPYLGDQVLEVLDYKSWTISADRVQGELKNGTTKLEHMLQATYSNEDALVLLGQLYPHTLANLSGKRLARLHEAAQSHKRNPDVLVCFVKSVYFLALHSFAIVCWK
jgi:hypothetical protein